MKRLIRYRKKIVSLMCAVMVISIGILSTSFDVNASNYTISMSRPEATTNSGYVELLLRDNNTGACVVYVFFWNSWGVDGNKTVDVIVSQDSCMLVTYFGYMTIFQISSDGRDNPSVVASGINSSYTFGASYFNCSILGYRVYGNVGACDSSIGGYIADWTVLYSDEATEVYELTQIYSQLVQANANDSTMINKINQIYNSLDTVETKLQQLIDLQEESNTWLEKIWNSIQEFITPKDADEEAANDFNAESEAQKNEIDSLNQQNQTEKVDVNSATSQVDSNINYDNMAEYGGVLATITNNNYVLQMILIVVSVAIIAYVLFGKR